MTPQNAPPGNDAQFSGLPGGVIRLEASFRDHSFERHSHDCFSIGMTTYGVQSFRCKRQAYNSQVGDLVLFNPDEDHDGHAGTADGFRYTIFYLPESLVRSCVDADAGLNPSPYFGTAHGVDPAIAAMFSRLSHALSSASLESLWAESVLRDFLGKLLARYGETSFPNPIPSRPVGVERMRRVREYMRAHFQRDITVAELAGIAGLSSAHFTRAFHSCFHVPPHVHLNSLRISHAKTLIRLRLPLSEVALESGFVDQSHLTRRFKGNTGISPSQWRKMICSK
jgi:AraC-like DNA-binding protein